MAELQCKNPNCGSNRKEMCDYCKGRKVNNRGSRCLECNGAGSNPAEEPAFNLHVVELQEYDFILTASGEVDVSKESDEAKASALIHCIKCDVCDEDIPIPKAWVQSDQQSRTDAGRAYALLEKEVKIPESLEPKQ